MGEHTVTSFDEDLDHIQRLIRDMGDLSGAMVGAAIRALLVSDNALAQRVISDDTIMDARQRELDDRAITLIAKRQPMAQDLRAVVGAIRMAGDLERIGDLAKNIAKRVSAVGQSATPRNLSHWHRSDGRAGAGAGPGRRSSAMSARDADGLKALRADDEKIDVKYTAVFRELLTYMMEDPRNITTCTHLLFCAKNLERIGDHVTNIAENAYYVVTGEQLPVKPPQARRDRARGAGRVGNRQGHPAMIAPKIMVVEDEEPLGVLLRYNLEAEGYQVEIVTRGDEAEIRLQENAPDLLVLDWMVPAISGIELCRRLRMRPETQRLPIIMLTARGEESDRVRGLSTGADDYLVKPFSTPEFMARVRALLRRAKPEVLSSVLKVGDIMLDREAHRVYRKKNEIKLGPTEFRLLEFMMRHPGRVFSRSQLLDNVWGETIYIDERTVDVHVGRLRKAVNNGRMPDVIRTIRGAGYAIRED